jgi:hypothetical protein
MKTKVKKFFGNFYFNKTRAQYIFGRISVPEIIDPI